MKFLIAAAALIIAAPAAAQTAPAHAEHSEHKGEEHKGEHKGCCDHKNADGSPMDCCKPGKDGKRAACCDKHAKHGSGEKHGAGHH
ncbi:MAG TPA: hypothetical protein VF631_11485 [Allosphingosinicella sp.]|jgi:hypothetical protein|uniref:hypothetical protein n=1 Tax=Allosphingosinicella sp. TaxID=2823234 RepID=UPI002F29A2F3